MNLLACHSFLIVTVLSLRNVHPILDMQSIQILDNAAFTFCVHFTRKMKTCLPHSYSLQQRRKKQVLFCWVFLNTNIFQPPNCGSDVFTCSLNCKIRGKEKSRWQLPSVNQKKDINNQFLSEAVAIKPCCRPSSLCLQCLGYHSFDMFLHFQFVFSELCRNVLIYFSITIFLSYSQFQETIVIVFVQGVFMSLTIPVSQVEVCFCKLYLTCSVSLKAACSTAWLFPTLCST